MSYSPSGYYRPGLREQGFLMTTDEGIFLEQGLYQYSPNNTSSYARFISGDRNFRLVHEQGLPFTVQQLDLAGYNSVINLTVAGVKSDGTIVSHTFNQLSLGDGYRSGSDFTTCLLPASFQQIRELRISQTGYYLDNIVVEPPAGEAPLPAPLPEPYLYDITWEDAPHQLNQMSATGGQRAPSSVRFGNTLVRERPNGAGRYLELSQDSDIYDQIELSLAVNARRYVIEYEVTHAKDSSTSFFLDLNTGFLRIDMNDGILSYILYGESLTNGPEGSSIYTASANNQFRIIWDEATGQVTLSIGGEVRKTWNIVDGSATDINGVRFSTSVSEVTSIDNVKIQAANKVPLRMVPADLTFFDLPVLTSQTVPITLLNEGTDPAIITHVRSLAPAFSFSGLALPVTVPAGGRVVLQITANPHTTGWKRTLLTLESDQGAATCNLSSYTSSVQTNYFTTHPASQTINGGSPLQLVSAFSGPSVLRFEWIKNGDVIPGDSTTLDVTASATATDAGVYQVKAYLTNGEVVTSNPAIITVFIPGFTTHPASKWVIIQPGLTSPLRLTCALNVPVSRYEWTRDGNVLFATGSSLTISSATLQDAGVYRVTAFMSDGKSYQSQPANVGVVLYSSATKTVAEGDELSHSIQIAGPGLTYSWVFDRNQPVSELPDVIEAGQRLLISPVSSTHRGVFTAVALMPNAAAPSTLLSSGTIASVTVEVENTRTAPELQTTTLGHAMVGLPYEFNLSSISTTPQTFSVNGLPDGLTLIASSGRIYGTPLASSIPTGTPSGGSITYDLSVTVTNSFGQVSRQVPLILHQPLSRASVAGLTQPSVFPGLRHATRVQGEITANNTLSLQILGTPRLQAIARLSFDQSTGVMKGRLISKSKSSLAGHPIRWDGQYLGSDLSNDETLFQFEAAPVVRQLNPAYHAVGRYPTALTVEVIDSNSLPPNFPYGSGVLNVKVGVDARVTYAGLLPDGSRITGSGEWVEDWAVDHGLRHPLLCHGAGPSHIVGWLMLGNSSLTGQLQWIRQPSRSHPTWPGGFKLDSIYRLIQVTGQRLVAPAVGETLMGLNRQIVVLRAASRDGWYATRRFRISKNYQAWAVPPATTMAQMSVQPHLGTFSGTMNMGFYKGKALTGSYHGVLLPDQETGKGFMLVPDLASFEEAVRQKGVNISIGSDWSTIMPMKPVTIELYLNRPSF